MAGTVETTSRPRGETFDAMLSVTSNQASRCRPAASQRANRVGH